MEGKAKMLISKLVKSAKELANSRDRNFYIQRWVGDVRKRERYADALAANAPAYQGSASEDLTSRMKKEGYCPLANIIQPSWIPEMVGYFRGRDCFDPYRAHLGEFRAPVNAPPESHVANYSAETVAAAPRAFAIANHPDVLAVVAATLGAKPTIALMSAWWSLPRADGKPEHAEMFHRDIDDYRFIKLFCYLTDVDEASGPHVFVRGSHCVNKHTEAKRRLPDDFVAQEFGADNILRFTGPAGTTFLENTFGIHRGIPAATKPRLIFQVLYSLRPLIYSPKKPFVQSRGNDELAQLDPYINRVYLR
jgi:hypothetical protein